MATPATDVNGVWTPETMSVVDGDTGLAPQRQCPVCLSPQQGPLGPGPQQQGPLGPEPQQQGLLGPGPQQQGPLGPGPQHGLLCLSLQQGPIGPDPQHHGPLVPIPLPYHPPGSVEQREQTLHDQELAFEDRKQADELHYERREMAHEKSRAELERSRREIQTMKQALDEDRARQKKDEQKRQMQKEKDRIEISEMQRLSTQKMRQEWGEFEERKAAESKAIDQKREALQIERKAFDEERKSLAESRRALEEQKKRMTMIPEPEAMLHDLRNQVAALQKINDELRLELDAARGNQAPKDHLVKVLAARDVLNEETERKMPGQDDVLDEETERKMSGQDDVLDEETERKMSGQDDVLDEETERKMSGQDDVLDEDTELKMTEACELPPATTESLATENRATEATESLATEVTGTEGRDNPSSSEAERNISSEGVEGLTELAVSKPQRSVPPRVVTPPPEPEVQEEEPKTLVLPSTAGVKPQFVSTAEKFLNMLQKHTGQKYRLEMKNVDNISEEDVLALPFSGSGPFHEPALIKALKDSGLKDTQRMVALGVFETRRDEQAWRYTMFKAIPVVYLPTPRQARGLVEAKNASAVCNLVASRLEEYYAMGSPKPATGRGKKASEK